MIELIYKVLSLHKIACQSFICQFSEHFSENHSRLSWYGGIKILYQKNVVLLAHPVIVAISGHLHRKILVENNALGEYDKQLQCIRRAC